MASGSTNRNTRANTGTKTGTRSSQSTNSGTRRRTNTQAARRRKQAVNDQALDDIVTIISAAICVFLFLCNFRIIGSFGNAISDFMFGIFGLFAYVAPLFIGGSVIFYNIKRGDYVAQ